jgi:hypothetical protein
VVDGETAVETGIFSFTASAERRNAENVIVLHAPAVAAQQHGQEWERLWKESEGMTARH